MKSSSAAEANSTTGPGLEGLDDFYDVEASPVQELPGNSQGTAQSSDNISGIAQWLTVEDAAKRLEISPNAVIKRLGKGKLVGRKVPSQFGERWMVDPNGLPQEIHVQVSEEQPSRAEEPPGSSKGTATREQEQPPQSQALSQMSVDLLADVIRQQTEQIKLQNEMIKYLSTQLESKDTQIKLLTDGTKAKSWWQSFCSWFVGAKG